MWLKLEIKTGFVESEVVMDEEKFKLMREEGNEQNPGDSEHKWVLAPGAVAYVVDVEHTV